MDKLLNKARFRLNAEIDLLQIIKQLRVSSFAAETVLRPHQRKLVRFFDHYNLKQMSDEDSNQSFDDLLNQDKKKDVKLKEAQQTDKASNGTSYQTAIQPEVKNGKTSWLAARMEPNN